MNCAIVRLDPFNAAWAGRMSTILVAVFIVISLVSHCYLIRKHIKSERLKWSMSVLFSIVLHFMSIVNLGVFLSAVNWLKIYDDFWCKMTILVGTAFYSAGKYSMHVTLSYRVSM